MCDAQILYLQGRIREMLFQEEKRLRKRVGHQNLLKRIQLLVADVELEICRSWEKLMFEDRLTDQEADVELVQELIHISSYVKIMGERSASSALEFS